MIDLAECNLTVMKFIKQRELCAVCVFAHEGKASKITYGDPVARLNRLRDGDPYQQISLEYLIWTPGEQVAKLVVSLVMQVTTAMESKSLQADWYGITPVILSAAVREVVHKYFSDAQIVDHAHLMRFLRQPRPYWPLGHLGHLT